MANNIFANGREIACKAGSGKVIAAFPDVCFTPPDKVPPTPPGVPVPYPLTSMASDTDKGTKKVLVSNKEVMKRDSSVFKKCAGDDAAQTAKKGLINSKLTGKVQFTSWSMNVKCEGKNVVRHLDLTTSNHGSQPANASVPFVYVDEMVIAGNSEPCNESNAKLTDEADTLPDSMTRIHEDAVTRGEAKKISDAYKGRSPPATTLAVGLIVGGGSNCPPTMTAHSRKAVGQAANRQHFAKGIDKPSAGAGTGCGSGAPFKYDKDAVNHRHAEAKIIEDWFKKGGQGQLVLNVSRPVCPNCANLIKHVNCGQGGKPNCNKIVVCEDNQNDEAKANMRC